MWTRRQRPAASAESQGLAGYSLSVQYSDYAKKEAAYIGEPVDEGMIQMKELIAKQLSEASNVEERPVVSGLCRRMQNRLRTKQ